jgi:hypothetical protein
MESIDRKHTFLAVNEGNGNVYTDKEGIILLAKDDAVLPTLNFYLEECKRIGAGDEQIAGVELLIARVSRWRAENPDACKKPDISLGKEADIVLSPLTIRNFPA